MVRLDKLNGEDGGFSSHRHDFLAGVRLKGRPDSASSDVSDKARNMFLNAAQESNGGAEPDPRHIPEKIEPPQTSQLDDLDAQVERLNDRFEQMEFTFAETGTMIGELRGELADMSGQISAANITQIADAVSKLSEAQATSKPTDPLMAALVKEMRGLRIDVTQRDEVTDRIEARLDGLARQVEAASAAPDAATVLQDHLTTRLDALNAVVSRIARDQDRLSQSLNDTTVPDALSALRDDLATLAGRAAPELDLTAQREGFAQFNQAAGAFLKRLEELVTSMASDHVRHVRNAAADAKRRDAESEELSQVLSHLSRANASLAGLMQPDVVKVEGGGQVAPNSSQTSDSTACGSTADTNART